MLTIRVEDIEARLPRPLIGPERARLGPLVEDAVDLIDEAFAREGRDFKAELVTVPWLEKAAVRVVREMVSAAVLVGENVGIRSTSIRSGQVSEAYTYADVDSVTWGGLRLTPDQLSVLGLSADGRARGSFPAPARWPERWLP